MGVYRTYLKICPSRCFLQAVFFFLHSWKLDFTMIWYSNEFHPNPTRLVKAKLSTTSRLSRVRAESNITSYNIHVFFQRKCLLDIFPFQMNWMWMSNWDLKLKNFATSKNKFYSHNCCTTELNKLTPIFKLLLHCLRILLLCGTNLKSTLWRLRFQGILLFNKKRVWSIKVNCFI